MEKLSEDALLGYYNAVKAQLRKDLNTYIPDIDDHFRLMVPSGDNEDYHEMRTKYEKSIGSLLFVPKNNFTWENYSKFIGAKSDENIKELQRVFAKKNDPENKEQKRQFKEFVSGHASYFIDFEIMKYVKELAYGKSNIPDWYESEKHSETMRYTPVKRQKKRITQVNLLVIGPDYRAFVMQIVDQEILINAIIF